MFTSKVLSQGNKDHVSLSLGREGECGHALIYVTFTEPLHSLGHSLDKHSIKLKKKNDINNLQPDTTKPIHHVLFPSLSSLLLLLTC